jgi:hypothetical protein
MKTRMPLLVMCLLAYASQAQESKVQLWKWTDANGVVHYSDTPGPGAVKVDLAVPQGQPGSAPVPTASASGSGSIQVAPQKYKALTIVAPDDQTSYFDADPVVNVQVDSDPELLEGDQIYLYVDGQRYGSSGGAYTYSLPNLPRGAHTLRAVIFDADGTEKIRSAQVTVYLKQPIATNPANKGPALRPPTPTPRPAGGG